MIWMYAPAIAIYSISTFFGLPHTNTRDVTEKSNEFYDFSSYTVCSRWSLIKHFVESDWTRFFLASCHRHTSSFKLHLFYSVLCVAARRFDGRGRVIVARRSEKKFTRTAEGRRGFTRAWIQTRFVCTNVSCVSRSHPSLASNF